MDKRQLLFKQLKFIKDYWAETGKNSLERDADLIWSDREDQYHVLHDKLCSEQEKDAFKKVSEELIKGVIHSVLVMIDGGDDLADKFTVDLVDTQTKESLKSGSALHEEFYSYLVDIEE
jgi:hypothetical protein